MKWETTKIYINKIIVIEQGLTENQALYWVKTTNDTLKHPEYIAGMRQDSREKAKEILSMMCYL